MTNFKRWVKASFVIAACVLASNAVAINKCTGSDGKVSYQEAACASESRSARVNVNSNRNSAVPVAKPTAAPPLAPGTATEPPPAIAATKSPLDSEATECLNWYKPKLRDPAGAYFTEASKQDRVLTISLHATNGYGGYIVKQAACEIHNGVLNDSWTKTHAKRRGWSQE